MNLLRYIKALFGLGDVDTFWMAREQQAKRFSLSAVEWLDARQLHF